MNPIGINILIYQDREGLYTIRVDGPKRTVRSRYWKKRESVIALVPHAIREVMRDDG